MVKELSEKEKWEIIGYIKVSPIRYNTLKTLDTNFLMPSEIAKNTGFRPTQISNALQELKEKELVECTNEHVRKGRLYRNTDLGLEILRTLLNNALTSNE